MKLKPLAPPPAVVDHQGRNLADNPAPPTSSRVVWWLAARGHISLVAIPLLFWSSQQFLSVLIRTTNCLWHSPTHSWWKLPLKSLALFGITVSAVLIGILLPGMARVFREWLGFSGWMFALIFQLIPWLVLFYRLIMVYRLVPSQATRFSEVWLGALVATLLICFGEWLLALHGSHQ